MTFKGLENILLSGCSLAFDMDGTIVPFCYTDDWKRPGWFRNCEPFITAIYMIHELCEKYGTDNIFICSVACEQWIRDEKIEWCKQYLPELPLSHIILTMSGEEKYSSIIKVGGVNPVLIDDHTANCINWKKNGAKAIKAMNGTNGITGVWKGPKLIVNSDEFLGTALTLS